ncbi:uncharacterized protein LOC110243739 [Exaiptasia diaphana]|uniref:BEN domain-containing protein n=1 Tax=Exaiptasia diaphana TaxID=2652724 RepID=A0A913XIX4_EXADI|nr:uncharacterized protein LOC110243739 [Exaiptasia diaphana]
MERKSFMDHSEAPTPERFAAILENQRAIMVNQSTILHNQNKILRGLEQLFTLIPSAQNTLNSQPTPTAQNLPVTPVVSVHGVLPTVVEPTRVEPALTQITVVPAMPLQLSNTRAEQPQQTITTSVSTQPNTSIQPIPETSYTNSMVTVHPAPVPAVTLTSPGSPYSSDDERAPQFTTRSEIMQIKCKSCSIGNFSVQLLRHIFQAEELANRNCSGTRGKEQVDPVRLKFIKETVFELYNVSAEERLNTWRHCVRAMDEFLRRPKNNRKFKNDSGPPTLVELHQKMNVSF